MAARVKEPRYALGALAGLAYFGWIFWFGLIGTGPGGDMPAEVGLPALAEALLPVPLAVLAVGWWMSGRTHMALAFTPAESQILFQAPIGRETLLQYKLVRSQLSIVPVSIMVAVFFGGAIGIPYRTGVPSIWLLFTTIHLHQIASGLIRATWSHQGPAGLRRQWLPILVLAGAFGAVVWALWPLGAAYETATGMAQFLVAVEVAFAHPAAVIVFMPFRIALGPLMAVEPMAWLGAMGGAVALMAAHYVWIIRIDAAFEETAAEAGIELLEITTAFKEGRLGMLRAAKGRRLPRPWFRLRPEGHPAVAIYWKGLTGFTRSTGLTQGLAMAVVFLGFWALLRAMTGEPDEAAAAAMALPGVLGFVSLLFWSSLPSERSTHGSGAARDSQDAPTQRQGRCRRRDFGVSGQPDCGVRVLLHADVRLLPTLPGPAVGGLAAMGCVGRDVGASSSGVDDRHGHPKLPRRRLPGLDGLRA
jgi:hypothetical protein